MGFIKKNETKKEEADSTEKKEYSFPEEAELKACRYCQVMIPKTAKVCPNCRKHLKKNWLEIFLLLCLLAACAAGVYYYVAFYSVTEPVSVETEVVQSQEAVQGEEADRMPEEGAASENEPAAVDELVEENTAGIDGTGTDTDTTVQTENLPEIPAVLEEPAGSEPEKSDGLVAGIETEDEDRETSTAKKADEGGKDFAAEKEDELEKVSESSKDGEPENESEAEKEDEAGKDDENATERDTKSEDAEEEEEKDRIGMSADDGVDDESDAEQESGADLSDGTVKITDISVYTEEEFRAICQRVDYKKLLRSQEDYLNTAVMEELTVMEQVDGGLFDENIYYLCRREDGQGIARYYIVRDDREEDDTPILAGDVIQVYGQLFGSCKLPGYLVKTRPVVPALTMIYYDLLEE